MTLHNELQLDELPTAGDVLEEQLQDPEFRAEWERTALARAVADAVVRYRTDHDLSQRELAKLLGWKQPQVARLELGEHNPTMETLGHLVHTLGLSIAVALEPGETTGRIDLRTGEEVVQDVIEGSDGGRITIATGRGSSPKSPQRKVGRSASRTAAASATSWTSLQRAVDELIRQRKTLEQQIARIKRRSSGGDAVASRELLALQRRLSRTLAGGASKSASAARTRRTISDPAVLQARRAAIAKAREALAAKRAAERSSRRTSGR